MEGKGKRKPTVINSDANAAAGALQHMGKIGEDGEEGVDTDAPGADVFTQLTKELESTKQV